MQAVAVGAGVAILLCANGSLGAAPNVSVNPTHEPRSARGSTQKFERTRQGFWRTNPIASRAQKPWISRAKKAASASYFA
jgi:hypothetical protein